MQVTEHRVLHHIACWHRVPNICRQPSTGCSNTWFAGTGCPNVQATGHRVPKCAGDWAPGAPSHRLLAPSAQYMRVTEHRVLPHAVRCHRVPKCAVDQALVAPLHNGLSTECAKCAGHRAPGAPSLTWPDSLCPLGTQWA